jgi:hypothetical protein
MNRPSTAALQAHWASPRRARTDEDCVKPRAGVSSACESSLVSPVKRVSARQQAPGVLAVVHSPVLLQSAGQWLFQERHSKKLKPMTIGAMTSNHHMSVNSVYIVTTTLRR